MRASTEKQLETDELKCLRERIEQLEANTVVHMPMCAGDAGAGPVSSPRSISPNGRFSEKTIAGLDASSIRSLCRDEARRALEEVRGELMGGDLLCDELLSGGAGLRPALDRLIAESPVAHRESALSREVAELRASVDGAAAAATAAATAEIGRLDGAFRSSLAAEVRDLGSLCEGVRSRIEALDQSAAEHIGRLSARLAELEVRSVAPFRQHAEEFDVDAKASEGFCSDAYERSERSFCSDAYDVGAGSVKSERSGGRGGYGIHINGPSMPGTSASTSMGSAQEPVSSHSLPYGCGGGGYCGDAAQGEVLWSPPPSGASTPRQHPRLQAQVQLAADDSSRGMALLLHAATTPRSSPRHSAPAAFVATPQGLGGASVAIGSCPSAAQAANWQPDLARAGPGKSERPSTPPKRHVPPGSAVALRSSPDTGGGSRMDWSSAPNSWSASKGEVKMQTPRGLEVRGGC